MPGHHLLNLLTHHDQFRYSTKVKNIASANLVAYWPLAEPSGTVITDVSGNGYNGVYTAVTLGQPGIGDGRTCAKFDGSTSYANAYSVGFAGAFNNQEGTIAVWARIPTAAPWTDATTRRVIFFQVDANNRISFGRTATDGQLALTYAAAGTTNTINIATGSTLNWMHLALTWSKSGDAVKAYYNGVQSGATLTGLGIWAGALAATTTNVGSAGQPSLVWSGTIQDVAVWSTPLTAAQVAQLASVG